ncbi:hypothetical protein TVAG_486330 [Trichomonas vaginalis G3]|uniref:Uncharacterized protein n=1 Tax=Trichomonas vaginalis (strain ATCC PRA-98 / G3) TaxID=412133 RepID=A2EEI0_TRIV3|nr:hypothetical protein TVAGG3_0691000 [Trichomonas vaginalis G3]EAY08986.1 hypothetical protein TVAG_486330 [Trichomonas vaginalis G3]KAI5508565.1 hypothetical protein TVAGG3_0691000 [Trichomonas vaginalis G3]|eukprot:XP_001321209.1 hypothetical protein [Trichomonas vaginalis G3]
MFLLCLVNLGESRLRRPRHHMREHIQANSWFGCHETKNTYAEKLVINRVDGDKDTDTVYTTDISSLRDLVATKYPLLLPNFEYYDGSAPYHEVKYSSNTGHFVIEIQKVTPYREGNQYRVVFEKGQGSCDYTAQTKTVYTKKCYGKKMNQRETFENRALSSEEFQYLLTAIQNKIGWKFL